MNTSQQHHLIPLHLLLLLLLPCVLLVRPSESRRVTGIINLQKEARTPTTTTNNNNNININNNNINNNNNNGVSPRRLIVKSLVLSNGLDWGEWQSVEYCPDGSFAVSAEAK
ncbi:hypothetical protein Pmani_016272, partial [Petrolisthes manimaculis]